MRLLCLFMAVPFTLYGDEQPVYGQEDNAQGRYLVNNNHRAQTGVRSGEKAMYSGAKKRQEAEQVDGAESAHPNALAQVKSDRHQDG